MAAITESEQRPPAASGRMRHLAAILASPAPAPSLTVRYGPAPGRAIDVWLPARSPARIVVAFHGGFWRAEYDRAYLRPLASALADSGYVVAVPEYRRVGEAGGGWPGTFDDVAAALDAIPALLAGHGTGRPVVIGHSAGGHLALWAAARHRLPEGSGRHRADVSVHGVLALAGCCDLARCSALGLGGGAVDALLGGPPEAVPGRYAAADPAALRPTGVPTRLVHGTADRWVPLEVSRSYAALARAAGDAVSLREVSGAGHFSVVDPLADAWPHVRDAVAGLAD